MSYTTLNSNFLNVVFYLNACMFMNMHETDSARSVKYKTRVQISVSYKYLKLTLKNGFINLGRQSLHVKALCVKFCLT